MFGDDHSESGGVLRQDNFQFLIFYRFFFSKTFEMLKSWNMLEHGQIVYLNCNELPAYQVLPNELPENGQFIR